MKKTSRARPLVPDGEAEAGGGVGGQPGLQSKCHMVGP
ncbi:rCG63255, partial [Rattus norvegicus]